MFRSMLCGAVAIIASAAVVAQADPKDDVAGGIAKLGAASNYTYVITSAGRAGPQVSTVKTKDGYTFMSRDFNGTAFETYAKGETTVIKNQDGAWMTTAEMAAANGGGQGGGRGRGGFGFGGPQMAPAAQLKAWEDKLSNYAAADGAISADVDPETAKTLVPAGRGRRGGGGGGAPPAAPVLKDVKATVKFWLADGNISKYELHVTGTRTVNDQDMPIDTTTSTEIKDIGTTAFDIPADAKTKLDAPPAAPAAQ